MMMEKSEEELAAKLGLQILVSVELDRVLAELVDSALDVQELSAEDMEYDCGDQVITFDVDSNPMESLLEVLSLSHRFPGRKTWVLGESEELGNRNVHIFAADMDEALARARKSLDLVKGLLAQQPSPPPVAKKFLVTVKETRIVQYEVLAESQDDAEAALSKDTVELASEVQDQQTVRVEAR